MTINYDSLLEIVGEYGPYQQWITFMLYLPCIFAALHVLSNVFTVAVPDHRCFVSNCDNTNSSFIEPWTKYAIPNKSVDRGAWDHCHLYTHITNSSCGRDAFSNSTVEACNRWIYSRDVFEETVVKKFNLVCDDSWKEPFSQSMFMIGMTVGATVFGHISDRYGRKKTILASTFLLGIFGTIQAFSVSFVMFASLRFISAMFETGMYQTCFVMLVEVVGKNKRMLVGSVNGIFFAGGDLVLTAIAYYFRNWVDIQLAISVPLVMFIPLIWLLPESARWLLSADRYDEAKTSLVKMANKNGVRLTSEFDDKYAGLVAESKFKQASYQFDESHSAIDLFRTPVIRRRTLNVFLNWFMNTLVYYGLSLSATSLGGDIFINFAFISAVEIPAYIFCIFVADRVGRRLSLFGCMVVGGTACLSIVVLPQTEDYHMVAVALAMVGKFGTSAAFAIIYVYTAELFPTVLRNTALGCSSTVAHFGAILAPFVATLGRYHPSIPMLVFGFNSIVVGSLSLFLPETLGLDLPESIADIEGALPTNADECLSERSALLFSSDSNSNFNLQVQEDIPDC